MIVFFKPCPWCLSKNLGISDKATTINHKRKRHVAVFCKDCNCYGPRFIAEEDGNHAVDGAIKIAIELWNNKRTDE